MYEIEYIFHYFKVCTTQSINKITHVVVTLSLAHKHFFFVDSIENAKNKMVEIQNWFAMQRQQRNKIMWNTINAIYSICDENEKKKINCSMTQTSIEFCLLIYNKQTLQTCRCFNCNTQFKWNQELQFQKFSILTFKMDLRVHSNLTVNRVCGKNILNNHNIFRYESILWIANVILVTIN